MTLKLASSVLRALNHGRLKLALESYAYGQLPAALNYNAAEPEKGREVDCMEPFNSAVLLCHSNTLSPLWLRWIVSLHSGTHRGHLVHRQTDGDGNVSLQVLVKPLGGALKSFH